MVGCTEPSRRLEKDESVMEAEDGPYTCRSDPPLINEIRSIKEGNLGPLSLLEKKGKWRVRNAEK